MQLISRGLPLRKDILIKVQAAHGRKMVMEKQNLPDTSRVRDAQFICEAEIFFFKLC